MALALLMGFVGVLFVVYIACYFREKDVEKGKAFRVKSRKHVFIAPQARKQEHLNTKVFR